MLRVAPPELVWALGELRADAAVKWMHDRHRLATQRAHPRKRRVQQLAVGMQQQARWRRRVVPSTAALIVTLALCAAHKPSRRARTRMLPAVRRI
eukprot:1613379-Prymnesium_polylepis.2